MGLKIIQGEPRVDHYTIRYINYLTLIFQVLISMSLRLHIDITNECVLLKEIMYLM